MIRIFDFAISRVAVRRLGTHNVVVRFYRPSLELGYRLPPQTSLVDKFGGLPWGLPVERWPTCSDCGTPQALLAQLVHDPERLDLGERERVLFVFRCEAGLSEGRCDLGQPGSGTSAVFVLPAECLVEGLTRRPANGLRPRVEARVRTWQQMDDGLDEALRPLFYEEDRWLDLPEEVHDSVDAYTRLGGVPSWEQSPALAPQSGWRFVLQLEDMHRFDGKPPKANDLGCTVCEMSEDGLITAREQPASVDPDAPIEVLYWPSDGFWGVPFTNFGQGTGYVFLPEARDELVGALTWQR